MDVIKYYCDGDLRIKLIGDQIHDFFGDRNDAEEEGANLTSEQKKELITNFNDLHGTTLPQQLKSKLAQENAEDMCGDINKFRPLQFLNQTSEPDKIYADFPQIASVVDYMYSSTYSYLRKDPTQVNYNVVIDAIKKNKTFDYAMNDFRLKNEEVINIYNTPEGKEIANKTLQRISFRPTLANLYDMATEDALIKNSIVKYGEIAKIKDEVSYNVSDTNGFSIQWTLRKFPNFIEIANYMKNAIINPQIAQSIVKYLTKEEILEGKVTKSNLDKISKVAFNTITDSQQKVQSLVDLFLSNGYEDIYGLLYKSMLDGIKKLNNTRFYVQGNKTQRTFATVFRNYFGEFRKVGKLLENAVTSIPLTSKENPQSYLNYHLNLVSIYYTSILGKEIYSYPNGNSQEINMNFIDYYSVKDVFVSKFSIKETNYTQEMLNVQILILIRGGPSVRNITRLIFEPILRTKKYLTCLLFSKTLCDLGVICSTFEDGLVNNNTVNFFTTFDITCALIGSSLRTSTGLLLAPFVLFNKVGEKNIPGIEVYLPSAQLTVYKPITDKVVEAAKSMLLLKTQPLYKEQCEKFKRKFLEGYDPEDTIIQELSASGCNNYEETMYLLEKLELQESAKQLLEIKRRPIVRAKRRMRQITKDYDSGYDSEQSILEMDTS